MRRRRLAISLTIAAASVLTALVAPGTSTPASAVRSDIIAVVLEGTGNGHGRGMSQWGAYGWAVDQSKSWQWILGHYYGGTVSGTVDANQSDISVRLTDADDLATVGVTSHRGGVRWNGTTRSSMYATEISPNRWEVFGSTSISCPSADRLTVPSGTPAIARGSANDAAVRQIQRFLKAFHSSAIAVDGDFGPQTELILREWQQSRNLSIDGVWNSADATEAYEQIDAAAGVAAWTSLGTQTGPVTFAPTSAITASSAPGDTLGLCSDDSSIVHYRGVLVVSSQSSGNRVVNELSTEAYLRGVVPKEIAASWAFAGGGRGVNAVRAQAVAARSYGVQQRRYGYADTCDTQSCQVYGGAATRAAPGALVRSVEHSATDAAIAATRGIVRRWAPGHANAGDVVVTEFSASNGPRTAGGAFPAVDDAPGDRTAGNPNHQWTRVLDADDLERWYGLGQLSAASMIEAASSQYRAFDGIWFNDLLLTGTARSERIQAWDLKSALGLPSPGFTVRVITEDTSGADAAVIGDSITASISTGHGGELPRVLDSTFASLKIDGVVSRCTVRVACSGTSGVQAAAQLPAGLDLVVVELGYNDAAAGFAAAIDQMMTALRARSVGTVAWVNMAEIATTSGGASRYGPMNAALDAAAARSSDLVVLDWDAATRGFEPRSRWFSDDVHLTATGRAEYSLWLRTNMSKLGPSHRLVPPRRIELPIIGATINGVDGRPVQVPATASAVALNIAAISPSKPGFVTVWPCGVSRPTTSNLNYDAGDVVANNVLAPIGDDGSVCLYSLAGTDLIADVAGWVDGAGSVDGFTAVTPTRVVDTRKAQGWPGLVTPNNPLVIDVRGRTMRRADGTSVVVPPDISALSINVTATEGLAAGHLTLWPCADDRPIASSLNFGVGKSVANGVTAAVDGSGRLCVYTKSSVHVVVDVLGWFGSGDLLTSATPKRVVDTRIGTGAPVGPINSQTQLVVPVRGLRLDTDSGTVTVPGNASAVILDVAAVGPTAPGYLTLWPCGTKRPIASNVNYQVFQTIANGVVAPIAADGTICVFSKSSSHVIVDVRGWFGAGAGGFTSTIPTRLIDTRIAVGPAPVR